MRRTFLAIIVLVLASCASAAPPPTPTMRSDYKLGIILNANGSIHDGTFNETSYKGALAVSQKFGLDFAYKETVEDKDYVPTIDKMVSDGRNIIVTVGFQMQDVTLAAAAKYPKVYFAGVDQASDSSPSNFIGIVFKEDQGGFLAGALAGMMTKTNVVGIIGGVNIPPIGRFVNGFINGVHYVNKDALALFVYTSDFSNVEEGRTNADKMIAQKADVIFGAGGLTGSSGIVRAAAQKVYVIGVDQDEYITTFTTNRQDAQYILTSAVKRADNGVYSVVADILNNQVAQDKGKKRGAKECGITFAPFHDADKAIPDAVKTRLDTIWRALAGETLFTGAGDDQNPAPPPLAPGVLPPVSATAPKLSDCSPG